MKPSSLVTIDPVDSLPTSPLLHHQQLEQQQHIHYRRRSSITPLTRSPSPSSSHKSTRGRMRSPPRASTAKTSHYAPPSSRRASPYTGPRSSSERRLPSLFDRIKTALEAPRQRVMTIDTSAPPVPPLSPIQSSSDSWPVNSSPSATSDRSTISSKSRFHKHQNYKHDYPHDAPLYYDNPAPPPPTLYGVPVSVACRRAYLGHNLGIRQSLRRLQVEDAGTVEHRTIAFSTHLTISRWESSSQATEDSAPASLTTAVGATKVVTQAMDRSSHRLAPPSTSKVTAEELADHGANLSLDKQERGAQVQQQQQLQHRDIHTESNRPPGAQDQHLQPPRTSSTDPVLANRLLLLANYIRHILSLTADNSALHNQATVIHRRLTVLHAQRQQQQQLQHQQQQQHSARNANHTYNYNYDRSDLPSSPSLSASISTAYNHQPPNVASLAARRNSRDQSHTLPSPMSAGPGPFRAESSFTAKRHHQTSEYHDYQTRRQLHHQPRHDPRPQLQQTGSVPDPWSVPRADHRGSMLLPSPISPTFRNEGMNNNSLAAKRSTLSSPIPSPSVTPRLSPLVKVPFQNLALTLALIYVDRLKAKYPEAKGEPGCSHRLFLVAYIIAAKYHCSVELETLQQELQECVSATPRSPSPSPRMMDLQPELYGPNGEYLGASHDDRGETTARSEKEESMEEGPEEELRQQKIFALQEKIWEARSKAELVFSNYEWIRLLSLGSFFSPPPRSVASMTMVNTVSPPPPSPPLSPSLPPTMPSAAATTTPMSASMTFTGSQTQNAVPQFASLPTAGPSSSSAAVGSCATMHSEERARGTTSTLEGTPGRSLPIQATPVGVSMSTTSTSFSVSSSSLPSSTATNAAPMILQVHDLDRMENEFLTFLDFDLSIGPHDLDTCWNLLVRNREI